MKVVVMRGCPGAGKSTYVATRFPDALVRTLDGSSGKPEAGWLEDVKRFEDDLAADLGARAPFIVIDRCNVTREAVKGYVNQARFAGYEVEVIRVDCDPYVAAARGIHGVSPGTVHRMARTLERNPWPAETVV